MAALRGPKSVAALPPQPARSPATKTEARARYFNLGYAFNVILPEL